MNKICTSIEQSKKLIEILSFESADMVHFDIHRGMDGKYYLSGTNTEDDVIPIYKNFCIKVFAKTTTSDVINQLPCWSLSALLNVLPNDTSLLYFDDAYQIVYDKKPYVISNKFDNPIDACYKMILKLHELKML